MKNYRYILLLLSFIIGTTVVMAQTSGYDASVRKSYSGYANQSSFSGNTYSTPFSQSSVASSSHSQGSISNLGGFPAMNTGSRYSPTMSAIGAHSVGINTPRPGIRRAIGDADNDENSGFGDGDDNDEPEDRPKPYENPIGDAPWLLLLLTAGWMIGKHRKKGNETD